MNNHDTALGDTTPSADPASGAAGGLFVSPPDEPLDLGPVKVWTIGDILAEAELPEKRAKVCLKANLQSTYDQLITELGTLVDATGKLLVDDEASAADVTPEARAREISDQLEVVQREMASSLWFPLFRGMNADDFAVFQKKHQPKGENADWTDYYNRLIAECSADDPKLAVEDVVALRKKLGPRAIQALITTATEVCARGGVDVPKLPGFLRSLAEG